MNQRFAKLSISFGRAIRSSIGCAWSAGFAPLAPAHYRITSDHVTVDPIAVTAGWHAAPVNGDSRLIPPI